MRNQVNLLGKVISDLTKEGDVLLFTLETQERFNVKGKTIVESETHTILIKNNKSVPFLRNVKKGDFVTITGKLLTSGEVELLDYIHLSNLVGKNK